VSDKLLAEGRKKERKKERKNNNNNNNNNKKRSKQYVFQTSFGGHNYRFCVD
jgi:hypothetical protein